MEKYKLLIPIALMAAILGGLIFIGANRKTEYTPIEDYTPIEELRPEQRPDGWHWIDYPDKGK